MSASRSYHTNTLALSAQGEHLTHINTKGPIRVWESNGRSAVCEFKEVNVAVTAFSHTVCAERGRGKSYARLFESRI